MRSLRRLSVVSVASLSVVVLLSSVAARAQFAPAPSVQPPPSANAHAFVIHISPPLTIQSGATEQSQPSATYRLPPFSAEEMQDLMKRSDAQKLALVTENEAPCYALRTYGFTTPQGNSSAPRLTSYTTCTPASKTHLKEIVSVPAVAK